MASAPDPARLCGVPRPVASAAHRTENASRGGCPTLHETRAPRLSTGLEPTHDQLGGGLLQASPWTHPVTCLTAGPTFPVQHQPALPTAGRDGVPLNRFRFAWTQPAALAGVAPLSTSAYSSHVATCPSCEGAPWAPPDSVRTAELGFLPPDRRMKRGGSSPCSSWIWPGSRPPRIAPIRAMCATDPGSTTRGSSKWSRSVGRRSASSSATRS